MSLGRSALGVFKGGPSAIAIAACFGLPVAKDGQAAGGRFVAPRVALGMVVSGDSAPFCVGGQPFSTPSAEGVCIEPSHAVDRMRPSILAVATVAIGASFGASADACENALVVGFDSHFVFVEALLCGQVRKGGGLRGRGDL